MRCCIPEYKFNLDKMVNLLVNDKRNNPSNYSLVVLSEGAEWEGFTLQEYGEPDAFGHRKKMSVAETFSEEIKRLAQGRNDRQRSDLRSARRRVRTSSTSWSRRTFGNDGLRRRP